MQCHEGLDAARAVSEWNFAAQIITIRVGEAAGRAGVFSEDFLIGRPLSFAMAAAGAMAQDWSGGTRIGDRLAAFNRAGRAAS